MPPKVVRRTLDLAGVQVPLIEITGSADGPQLTVLAGVHGCEYASIAGIRRWARAAQSMDLRGRVRAVPVLNMSAFRARRPFVVPEDGKNLNRCFPGNPSGTLAERLAHATFTQLIAGADAVVDVHCGDLVEALEPFTLYETGPAEDRARALATAYGLGYVLRQEPGRGRAVGGTTSAAAAQIGVPAITAEAGGCGLVEQAAVDLHVRGLDRVLAELGMTDTRPASADGTDGVASRRPGRRQGVSRPGARQRQQHRRRQDAGGDQRAGRRGAAVHDQFARGRRGRPAARPRRPLANPPAAPASQSARGARQPSATGVPAVTRPGDPFRVSPAIWRQPPRPQSRPPRKRPIPVQAPARALARPLRVGRNRTA